MNQQPSASPDYGMGEKNLTIYMLGLFLCLILTVVPFATVQYAGYSYTKTVVHVYLAMFVQFLVQVICFLRLNWSTEQSKMNVLSFLFSIVVTAVIVTGSLWIMWNLNYYMAH